MESRLIEILRPLDKPRSSHRFIPRTACPISTIFWILHHITLKPIDAQSLISYEQ